MQEQRRKPPTDEFCPNCGSDNREYWAGGKPPPFCMTCRFPLLLIAGKYRLVRELNEGGCGTVYEARHTRLSRDPKRAIKIIKPELMKRGGMKTRFRREVQVTGSLSQQNQHIVRIYDDFGEEPGLGYYYIMEFLEGDSVDELLYTQGSKLPLTLAYSLFAQLCDAIQDAHAEEIIHRDLKPENLFVVPKRRDPHFLKVIDFGIAKPVGNDQEVTKLTGGALGTPAYMSPEQCTNSTIDARTDIYAMGCILFELLTGFAPFSAQTMGGQEPNLLTILTYHMSSPPPHLHDHLPPEKAVPAAMADVIAKAMAKDPDDRFSSVEALERAFFQAKNDDPTQAHIVPSDLMQEDEDDEGSTFVRASAFLEPSPGKSQQVLPTTDLEHTPLPASLALGAHDNYLRQAAPTSPDDLSLEEPSHTKSALLWVVAALIPLLAGVVWWATRTPKKQPPPQRLRAALPPLHQPTRAAVRPGPGVAKARPTRTRPVLVRPLPLPDTRPEPLRNRPRTSVKRPHKRRFRPRPRPLPQPRAHRATPPSPSQTPGRIINLCPQSPGYYWVRGATSPQTLRKLAFSWQGGRGRVLRMAWGVCIGASSPKARLTITRKGYYPCRVSIWGRKRETYRLSLISTDEPAPSTTNIDFDCLK